MSTPSTSRHHCRLQVDNEHAAVEDFGSKHGTWVNNRRVVATSLEAGDVLQLGRAVFRYWPAHSFDAAVLDHLFRLAMLDELTGAWSRRYIVAKAQEALASDEPCSIALADLDHFKRVNDTLGHAAGDMVLKRTVETMQSELSRHAMLGRFGGEEFLIVLPLEVGEALAVLERVRAAVAATSYSLDGVPGIQPRARAPLKQTVSIGVSATNGRQAGLDQIIAVADLGLLSAKRAGRNRVGTR